MVDHDRRRTLLGGQGTFERISANLLSLLDTVPMSISARVNIDGRNAGGVLSLLESLAARGLAGRKNFGVYFAPVEAITEGCHSVAGDCLSKRGYAEIEVQLTRRAFDLGLAALPYPRRFPGICGAVRQNAVVVLPNGDLHKCWDTVSTAAYRIGSIFDPDAIASNAEAQRWSRWTPFDHDTCVECKLLPNCAGSCAHKILNADQVRGEAALPCPSWKFNINERLVLRAERSGAITSDDYEPSDIETDPLKICAAHAPDAFWPETRERALHVISLDSLRRQSLGESLR
jgi:uncharacterized protein